MPRSAEQLERDALTIWNAGVEGASSSRLMAGAMAVEGRILRVVDEPLDLDAIRRVVVVGAGKAGAGMAAAVEDILGPDLLAEKHVAGWVNVPADCVRPLTRIHLHPAREAGCNEPTAAGVAGTREIIRLVAAMQSGDLCLCLISGGGSALLTAPATEITLADKIAVTRHLSGSGANIEQLNTVRRQLSAVKGGRLARQCRAGRLIGLIISDVLGDPLDGIASGPTAHDTSTAATALEVLEMFEARSAGILEAVFDHLRQSHDPPRAPIPDRVTNHIIGNNATAVDAAGAAAEQLGYSHAMISSSRPEGPAEEVAAHLAEMALRMRTGPGPDCLISGGEPTVRLVSAARRGRGGRNQQLVLAAAEHLGDAAGIALVSGGTDGEDGPTDAAGAVVDARRLVRARVAGLDPGDYLARNDAYHFFEPIDGLVKTGPTGTNVCDLRVVVVDRQALAETKRGRKVNGT